ncbi:MAG: hypothetical protein M5U28_20020 [Sandaracinaceae bacterium]|nr:hypothetical protein [Sandaracinaceae bacterium]
MMARRMALAAVLLAACDGPAHCTQAELQAALDAARPGDEVHVGSCRIEGGVRVPAGVTLRGVGADSVIAPAEGTGVFLEPGEPAARVADLVVEAGALAGIGSAGGGRARPRGRGASRSSGWRSGPPAAGASTSRASRERS